MWLLAGLVGCSTEEAVYIGKVYEVVSGSAALLCWRNGVKEREKVAELPPSLDELWGDEELAWSLVKQ